MIMCLDIAEILNCYKAAMHLLLISVLTSLWTTKDHIFEVVLLQATCSEETEDELAKDFMKFMNFMKEGEEQGDHGFMEDQESFKRKW